MLDPSMQPEKLTYIRFNTIQFKNIYLCFGKKKRVNAISLSYQIDFERERWPYRKFDLLNFDPIRIELRKDMPKNHIRDTIKKNAKREFLPKTFLFCHDSKNA